MFSLVTIAALFVSFAAIEASEEHPCQCYPNKMSGEVYYHNRKVSDFYADYDLQKIVEEHTGSRGHVSSFVYDLENDIQYNFLAGDPCETLPLRNMPEFEQCLPNDATKTAEDDHSVTYSYSLDDVELKRTLNKETCVPITVTIATRRRTTVLTYTSGPASFDEGRMNPDVSSCEPMRR